jgi:hypothetical protein
MIQPFDAFGGSRKSLHGPENAERRAFEATSRTALVIVLGAEVSGSFAADVAELAGT